MTGRQKIEAAFSEDGSPEIPAVICYEGIYVRDHWETLTSCPWWYREAPEIDRQMVWWREVIDRTGQDWFHLPFSYSREVRENFSLETRPEGVVRVDRRSGEEAVLKEPQIAGWSASGGLHSVHRDHLAETPEEIDELIPIPAASDSTDQGDDGRGDLAAEMLKEFGEDLYPICSVTSPLWRCYSLWGFEGLMRLIAARPDLVAHACQRSLALCVRSVREAALLKPAGIWIEESFTDIISPQAFEVLNLPFLVQLIEEIHAAGLKAIYYFCGNPEGKWEQILSAGADAVSLEESKKDFVIDIEDVVARVQGRCTVLGNLDAVGILQNGTREQLRTEVERQIASGRRNGNRFIMSLGSPVTPGTPVESVRMYCDLVHELGAA